MAASTFPTVTKFIGSPCTPISPAHNGWRWDRWVVRFLGSLEAVFCRSIARCSLFRRHLFPNFTNFSFCEDCESLSLSSCPSLKHFFGIWMLLFWRLIWESFDLWASVCWDDLKWALFVYGCMLKCAVEEYCTLFPISFSFLSLVFQFHACATFFQFLSISFSWSYALDSTWIFQSPLSQIRVV